MKLIRNKEQAASLPAYAVAAQVTERLSREGSLVVCAPPGAGKSTVLPFAVLDAVPQGEKVLMLEPRRIAARQVAERMAFLAGEKPGGTVGYRMRFESRVSSATRIEVLTEGVLGRMIVDDPTLDGVGAVIFDEFHERSLAADEALALVRETRSVLRPDLKLVIMSATIDAREICSGLGAGLVESGGRMFPVEIVHTRTEADERNAAETVAAVIRDAHSAHEGDILAFLPGEADIRRCVEILGGSLGATRVLPLYGMLTSDEQREAIAPSRAGERKVVLATPIAETSITIEGVRVVVDSGLCRKMVFDPQSGLSRLETVRISKDMAAQRAGRAGRVAPGVCYRLWSLATGSLMAENRRPEILDADLAPVLLDILSWGGTGIGSLPWLTPPPPYGVSRASALLETLGASDVDGRITETGRKMAAYPCHPRIASMFLRASSAEEKSLAADIAALLEERDPLPDEGSDIGIRITALHSAHGARWSRIRRAAGQYRRIAGAAEAALSFDPYSAGALISAAYPERVGKSVPGELGSFSLAGGGRASVDRTDPLADCEYLAIASMNSSRDRSGRIFMASPVHHDDLLPLTRQYDNLSWSSARKAVVASREMRLGSLVLGEKPLGDVPRERVVSIVSEAARKEGLSMFDFSDDVADFQRRVAFVASRHPELELPDLDTDSLLERAGEWLPSFIGRTASAAELKKIDMVQVLRSMLEYSQQEAVDRLAPSHLEVPTGSRIRLEYRQGNDVPVLRVRLQECFGLTDTPMVDGGRVPVLMELLSPGFKPVQLTSDLRSFWSGTYFEVRKELRRRYPKHSWPDNPLEAEAVRGARRCK